MAYMSEQHTEEVYSPEQLGISWGDVKGGLEQAWGTYGKYQEATTRAKVAQEQMAAQAAAAAGRRPGMPGQGFMSKYGLYLALGGAAIVAFLVLRKKK